jgi:hypothetical protein
MEIQQALGMQPVVCSDKIHFPQDPDGPAGEMAGKTRRRPDDVQGARHESLGREPACLPIRHRRCGADLFDLGNEALALLRIVCVFQTSVQVAYLAPALLFPS